MKRIAVILFVLGLLAPASAAQGEYYHYKESRFLAMDLEHLAVFKEPASGPVSPETWQEFGIQAGQVEPLPVAGWTLVGVPAELREPFSWLDLMYELSYQETLDFAAPVFFDDFGAPLIPTRILRVRFVEGTPAGIAESILAAGAGRILERDWAGMPRAYRLDSLQREGWSVLEIANQLALHPSVSFAAPNMIFTGRSNHIPNDRAFHRQWHHRNTGQNGGTRDKDLDSTQAWDTTRGSGTVAVVIIDNGVQPDHPDLFQIAGTDTTSECPDPPDDCPAPPGKPVNECDDHGTAVAGTVSAIMDNFVGIAGLAPLSPVASARTFISDVADPCPGTWYSEGDWTVQTLAWAESLIAAGGPVEGGRVITNNSNAYGFTDPAIDDKYADTRADGMVHFAATGNAGNTSIDYPSSLPSVMAIGAFDRFGSVGGFSNTGPGLSLVAPGVEIWTTDRTGDDGYTAGEVQVYPETDPNDFALVDGTSFASPLAAGTAALILSLYPDRPARVVERVLMISCIDEGADGYDTTSGHGLLNAHRAIRVTHEPDLIMLTGPASANPGQVITLDWTAMPDTSNYRVLASDTLSGGEFRTLPIDIGPDYRVLGGGRALGSSTGSFSTQPLHPRYSGRTLYFEIGAWSWVTGTLSDSNAHAVTVN